MPILRISRKLLDPADSSQPALSLSFDIKCGLLCVQSPNTPPRASTHIPIAFTLATRYSNARKGMVDAA